MEKEENVEMLKRARKKRKKKEQRSKSEWLPQIDFELWELKEECE